MSSESVASWNHWDPGLGTISPELLISGRLVCGERNSSLLFWNFSPFVPRIGLLSWQWISLGRMLMMYFNSWLIILQCSQQSAVHCLQRNKRPVSRACWVPQHWACPRPSPLQKRPPTQLETSLSFSATCLDLEPSRPVRVPSKRLVCCAAHFPHLPTPHTSQVLLLPVLHTSAHLLGPQATGPAQTLLILPTVPRR